MSRHRLKILIVDDHVEFCQILSEILTDEGYDSHCVANGQEALNRLKTSHPALILLDWQMPVMGGAEFLRRRKSTGNLVRIPVIVLSAAANIQKEITAAGVPFIAKPVDMPTLLSAIVRLVT